ncbi:uncharacterized protein LOC143021461 isoform X2 [Oratosquilla oratoria]|uniref:uncharacterized protein LOC143021461 isoform X2 n=1 Tax=Oratosquilla oratoria TaxID=337810 RepID=UPI003F76C3E9
MTSYPVQTKYMMDNEAFEKEQSSSSKCNHHQETTSPSPPPSPPPDYETLPGLDTTADLNISNGEAKPISPVAPDDVALTISDQETSAGEEDPIQVATNVCACEVSNTPCNCRSSPGADSRTPLAMTSPSAATAPQEKSPVCCSKCRPIYERQGQVPLTLDPTRLLHEVNQGHGVTHLPRSAPKRPDKLSLSQSYQVRDYGSMCACVESGRTDPQCGYHNASKWQLCLPRNTPWWPTLKRCLLVFAALIPIVFLIVYIVLHQLWKG